jgi:hypothetical protein
MTQPFTATKPMTIAPLRARNPLVAPSLFRQAGSHRARGRALRQQAAHALRREIAELPPPHRE